MAISRRGRIVLLVHAAVVLVLVLAFVVIDANSGPDANIGAGLVGLPLLALGVPWSLFYFADPYAFDDVAAPLRLLAIAGPAVLNVVLHALVWWLVGRRRA
ncbi:hypothetical protein [Polymorphospora sp. NPDC050346]|uniref:hypothetical protein n=1 Tax=unclassified Polymorphospora TaxID=2685497 RepID=UPI0033EF3B13